MLGKLIKHEFKTTSKLILPLYLVLVILTVLARITTQILFMDNPQVIDSFGFGAFSTLTIIMYVLGLIVISVTTFIYLIMRFYKNLFSNEGYLMHTLPVTSWQLLFSKLIVSFIWLSIEILLVALSIFCIFANHDLFKAVSDYLAVYGGLASFIKMITGMNIVLFWVNMVIFFILSVLNTILLPYASICIGQLWQRHKLAGSFLSYIVIQIVLQIISFIYTIFKMANITTFNAENYFPMSFYAFSLILTLITSIIYFVICGTVMKKKINLD